MVLWRESHFISCMLIKSPMLKFLVECGVSSSKCFELKYRNKITNFNASLFNVAPLQLLRSSRKYLAKLRVQITCRVFNPVLLNLAWLSKPSYQYDPTPNNGAVPQSSNFFARARQCPNST